LGQLMETVLMTVGTSRTGVLDPLESRDAKIDLK